MKKALALTALILTFISLACLSEGIMLPEGTKLIESEAFIDADADSAYIPESCEHIAPNAFGNGVGRVYGVKGSAAERFAESTGRKFTDVGIYDIEASFKTLCLPNSSVNVKLKYICGISAKASFELYMEDKLVSSSESGALKAGESGTYDLIITIKNAYLQKTIRYDKAISVIEPPKLIAENMEIPAGVWTEIVSPNEERECSIKPKYGQKISASGTRVYAESAGEYNVTVTVKQDGLSFSETRTISVYTPASKIICDTPEYAYAGANIKLKPEVMPTDAKYRSITYSSSNPSAVSVSEDGVLSYNSAGKAVITLTTKDASQSFETECAIRPRNLKLYIDSALLAENGTAHIDAVLYPEGSLTELKWTSSNEDAVTVDEDGFVTGKAEGAAVIVCEGKGVWASVSLNVKTAPQKLFISSDFTHLQPGESRALELMVKPKNTYLNEIYWQSSNEEIATVDNMGVVTAVSSGECVISASAKSSAVSYFTVRVAEKTRGITISLGEERQYINLNETRLLEPKIYPSDTERELVWYTSDQSVITVNQEGEITGVSEGSARIIARLKDDASVSASLTVNVLSDRRELVMPLRKTTLSGIDANIKRINSVKSSALDELKSIYAANLIGESELSRRKSMIENLFSSYAFPWMTYESQAYWNDENSQGGLKNFEPGVVYYGLPYISGDYGRNRLYDVRKAVAENRYYLSEDGAYYILNRKNLLHGTYAGCDCSSFVCIAHYGYGISSEQMRTGALAYSADLRTLDSNEELYPGDILVSGFKHVVVFLYYANDAHTQIVTIEQGGSENGINTVSANVYPISYFYDNGFIPRRFK